MITLTTTIVICFIISFYKINKACKILGKSFNPFEAGFWWYLMFFISSVFFFGTFLFACFTGILP